MSYKKSRGTPIEESSIDDTSLNFLIVITAILLAMLIVLAIYFTVTMIARAGDIGEKNPNSKPVVSGGDYPFKQDIGINHPDLDDKSIVIMTEEDISAKHGIIYNVTDNKVIASRQASTVIYPASMTKVMTLIVVVENLKSADDLKTVLTISAEQGENSGYGFRPGEKLMVEDLLYASILRSDGVACLTLAEYIAGSEANFVKLMNEKARELGLSEKTTLFQNCTGLHNDYHYSTCSDIAVIMSYAIKNMKCYEILSALYFRPSENFRPGDGCVFWNM